MALKRFFPIQDAFIVEGLCQGTGRDEILEIGSCNRPCAESSARILIEFSTADLTNFVSDLTAPYRAVLHLYAAARRNIPAQYKIECYELIEAWSEGLGRVTDSRFWTPGVSWTSRDGREDWEVPGGTIGPEVTVLDFTESDLEGRGDLEIDVTTLLQSGRLRSLLLKSGDEDSFYRNGTNLAFFSSNAHTIYKPCIEISYDDSVHDSVLDRVRGNMTVVPVTLQPFYNLGDKVRIGLRPRPLYPPRVFSTSSLYLNNYILPENSYWGIRDTYTADILVDFSAGTKISADNSGNYFILDTDLLTSERYLDLLVRVESDGTVNTYKVGSPFRIKRTCRI